MNTAIHPKDTEPHYRQGPHVLSCRLDEANYRGCVALETVCQLQGNLHMFRPRRETCKALVATIADDDRPLVGRRAARLLKAWRAQAKMLGHLCEAWIVLSWDAKYRDGAVLAVLGVWGAQAAASRSTPGICLAMTRAKGTLRVPPVYAPRNRLVCPGFRSP